MALSADSPDEAVTLVEQATDALARAASVLRHSPEYDELALATIRLEAEAGMLTVQISHARQRPLVPA